MNLIKLFDILSTRLPNCDFLVTCYPKDRDPGTVKVITIGVQGFAAVRGNKGQMKVQISRSSIMDLTQPEEMVANIVYNTWKNGGGRP